MKSIMILLFVYTLVLMSISCRKDDTYQNPHYDRMHALADQFRSNPSDQTPLLKLKQFAAGSDYWDKVYAYSSLEMLAFDNVGGCRTEIIPLLGTALKDADHAIRRDAVSAIRQIGAVAVESTLPLLLEIVRDAKEDDVTWFSAEALGKLDNREKAPEVLAVLLNAASTPPPDSTQDEAPQVRGFALEAIAHLAKVNNLEIITQLEQVMNSTAGSYKQRIAKFILRLDPKNTGALHILNPDLGK